MKNRTPVAYAVAVWTGRRYIFFAGYVEGRQAITVYPSCAKLYDQEIDASACADFLGDGSTWEVVPIYEK